MTDFEKNNKKEHGVGQTLGTTLVEDEQLKNSSDRCWEVWGVFRTISVLLFPFLQVNIRDQCWACFLC